MMSDLERLTEALAEMDQGIVSHRVTDVVVAAARAYRDLLANGWCEEHHHRVNHSDLTDCMWGAWYDARYQNGWRHPCRIVSRLLVVPTTEEE